ncbi:MAG: ABC transporter permease [Alphaproteobacteria bacterium]|nr:ABC transporter permease [Alphaproteobacteria bacterium]
MTGTVLTAVPEAVLLSQRVIGVLRRSPTFAVGFLIVGGFALLAVLAPIVTPFGSITAFPFEVLQPPNEKYLFGSDGNGMDVFSRVIYGARYAFGISVPAAALMLLIGVPLGLYAGYVGGIVDEVLLRIMDVVRSFPSIVMALAVVAATGQSVVNVVLVIGVLDSPIFARVVRAEVLALRSSAFIESAIAAGNPTWRILFVHLLPNAIRGATALIAVRMAWAVRISATLAFIGVGIQPPTPEWGAMIRQGAEYIISGEWWVATFPGLALVGVVLGFNLLGDGLQDLLDPKRRTAAR